MEELPRGLQPLCGGKAHDPDGEVDAPHRSESLGRNGGPVIVRAIVEVGDGSGW